MSKTIPIELTEDYIEDVKRALADAGVPVYYDEATLPDYVDLFLTPLDGPEDEANATILGWRQADSGWYIVSYYDGKIVSTDRLGLPLFADPADVAREAAALPAETPAETPADAIAEAEAERRRIIAEGGDVTDIEARITALRVVAPATTAHHLGNAVSNLPDKTTETHRETRYRLEERHTTDGTVAHAFSLGELNPDEAWLWLNAYRRSRSHRYTPHGARRLVLLAVGGAK